MSDGASVAATLPLDSEAGPPARARFRVSDLWRTKRRVAALLAFVAALVYVGSLLNGFAYDDVSIVGGDPRVTKFQFLEIWRQPYWPKAADLAIYRPLTTLSFAVDWLISRGYPWYFHAVNVAEHAVVSVLVFMLLGELFAPAAALLGALVFAVHPVHVEAVANVVGRAEIASAIFYLGAILIWVRGGERPPWRRTAGVVACYAAALLYKESSATLPAALLLVDAARGRWRLQVPSLREYSRRAALPVLALALVLGGYLALRLHVLGRMSPTILDPIFDLPMSPWERFLTALQAWPQYARLLFFPAKLLPDYGPRILMPLSGWTAGAALGLVLLVGLALGGAYALWRGHRRTALGLLWFPLTILPVSNLVFPIGIIVAERTLYLPMLALCVLVAGAAEHAARASPRARSALGVATALAVALLGLRAVVRVPVWDSTDRLFFALNADAPQSFRGWWHLARVARREKKPELEMARYDRALALWPYRRAMIVEAINRRSAEGRKAAARDLARFAAAHWPRDAGIQRQAIQPALDAADTALARAALLTGLRLAPRDSTLAAYARLPWARSAAAPGRAGGNTGLSRGTRTARILPVTTGTARRPAARGDR